MPIYECNKKVIALKHVKMKMKHESILKLFVMNTKMLLMFVQHLFVEEITKSNVPVIMVNLRVLLVFQYLKVLKKVA